MSSSPPPMLADDVYTDDEIATISSAFSVLSTPHAAFTQQITAARWLAGGAQVSLRVLAELDSASSAWAGDPYIDASVCAAAHEAVRAGLAAQKQIAGALGAFANMVASRVQRERLAIYGTLAKVQPSNTQSSQRCDERCLVGQSGAGGVVVRQKCCGALVCTNCLFVHNFQGSQLASHLHAPCFSCQRMRGIFKRTAAAK